MRLELPSLLLRILHRGQIVQAPDASIDLAQDQVPFDGVGARQDLVRSEAQTFLDHNSIFGALGITEPKEELLIVRYLSIGIIQQDLRVLGQEMKEVSSGPKQDAKRVELMAVRNYLQQEQDDYINANFPAGSEARVLNLSYAVGDLFFRLRVYVPKSKNNEMGKVVGPWTKDWKSRLA